MLKVSLFKFKTPKSVTSVRRPEMKRDAGVTAFTPASLFIFGRQTDVMALANLGRCFFLRQIFTFFDNQG